MAHTRRCAGRDLSTRRRHRPHSGGATQRFVEDIVSNHAIIAVVKSRKRIGDVWVTDDVEKELRFKQAEEEIEFRYWNGTNARRSAG